MNKDKITKIMICKTEKSRTKRSKGFPGGSDGKESDCSGGDLGSILDREDPLEKELATHFSIVAWRNPQTEEPGGLQSIGSHRVRYD